MPDLAHHFGVWPRVHLVQDEDHADEIEGRGGEWHPGGIADREFGCRTELLPGNGEHGRRGVDAYQAAARSVIECKLAPGSATNVEDGDVVPWREYREADSPEYLSCRFIEAVIEARVQTVGVVFFPRRLAFLLAAELRQGRSPAMGRLL